MYSTECNDNSHYLTCQQTSVAAICLHHYDDTNSHRKLRDISLKTRINCCKRYLFAIQTIAVTIHIKYYIF